MNTTNELAMWLSKGDVAVLQTSDLGLFWSCRYRSLCRGEGRSESPPCVWDECDFHVNWLHVSRIGPTHKRLNDDFAINTKHTYRCVCVLMVTVACPDSVLA